MNDKAHWSKNKEKGSYFSLWFMFGLYKIGGRFLFSIILYPVIAYYFLTSGRSRKASMDFLRRVWETPKGKKALGAPPTLRTVFKHILSFGFSVLDKMASWHGKVPLEKFTLINHDLFKKRITAGRGGIWLTSHLGNLEVCQAVFQQVNDTPITALIHTEGAESFNRFINKINPSNVVRLLQVSDFDMKMALLLRERVARGEFIFIAADRTPISSTARVVKAPFFGKLAAFPFGPFLLGTLLDCPIGAIFCLKTDKGFDLAFHDLPGLGKIPRGQRKNSIQKAVERYAILLEDYCSLYPLQWYNFFDYWAFDVVNDDAPEESPGENAS